MIFNSTKKQKENYIFLHEIGKKLIQITLYLFNHVNMIYFFEIGK